MLIYLNIVAIIISLCALIFSIVSFKRSQKIKRIENYLQFGTPKEMDEELKYLKEKRAEKLDELNREHIKRKKAIITDFSSRGLLHSGPMKQALKEADTEKTREDKKIERDFNHKINMLGLKKGNLAKL